jgi:hypothetical protein
VSLFFLFLQFEFTHAVGPHAARYVVGADAPAPTGARSVVETRNEDLAGVRRRIGGADVLVVGVVEAPAARPKLLRRARPADVSAGPAAVPLSLVTFVKGTRPFQDEREASSLLGQVRQSEEAQDAFVGEALEVLNLAIRAHRAGTHDPYALEVTRRDARSVRIGYGSTEEVQEGRWRTAIELPPPSGRRPRRIERLRPAEAVAGVLAGHATVLESEDLLVRGLIDLDNGRTRAAAFQVNAALRLLTAETGADAPPEVQAVCGLAGRAGALEASAAEGSLSEAQAAELESIIDEIAAALDARRYDSVA